MLAATISLSASDGTIAIQNQQLYTRVSAIIHTQMH